MRRRQALLLAPAPSGGNPRQVRLPITGGAGFIGSAIVTAALDGGHEVVVLDALLPRSTPTAGRLTSTLAPPGSTPTSAHSTTARSTVSTRSATRSRWSVSESTSTTSRTSSRTTSSVPRSCSPRWPASRSAPSCSPAAWSFTARAATPVPTMCRPPRPVCHPGPGRRPLRALPVCGQAALTAYNVTRVQRTVGEMAMELALATDGPTPVVTGHYRLDGVRHIVASPAKAAAELGFTAQSARRTVPPRSTRATAQRSSTPAPRALVRIAMRA